MRVARKLSKKSKRDHERSLLDKRKRLQAKIDKFIRQGRPYLGIVDATPESAIASGWYDVENGADTSEPITPVSNPANPGEPVPAERVALPLPSSFGPDICQGSLKRLADCEAKLREGQANDMLHALRHAIAKKSFVYRSKVRQNAPTNNYVKRLRSYGDVQAIQISIDHAAKIYSTARRALITLGATTALEKLHPLKKEDLKASTAVADSNAPHQGRELLSWIWHSARNSGDPALVDESQSRSVFSVARILISHQYTELIGFVLKLTAIGGRRRKYFLCRRCPGLATTFALRLTSGGRVLWASDRVIFVMHLGKHAHGIDLRNLPRLRWSP